MDWRLHMGWRLHKVVKIALIADPKSKVELVVKRYSFQTVPFVVPPTTTMTNFQRAETSHVSRKSPLFHRDALIKAKPIHADTFGQIDELEVVLEVVVAKVHNLVILIKLGLFLLAQATQVDHIVEEQSVRDFQYDLTVFILV